MQLISASLGPLDVTQATQVLSDTNADFAVIGICSAESSNEAGLAAALGGLLTSHQQQAVPTSALQGLQMHVHPRDRIIVLDASHILSSDVLSALLAADRPQPAVGSAAAATVRAAASRAGSSSTIPVEGVASLLSLQMLTFLLAVCNVVVVGATDLDVHLLQLLEACCLITCSTPDLALPQAVTQQQQQQAINQQGRAVVRRGRGQQQQQHRQPGGVERPSSGSRRQRQQPLTAAAPHHLADLVLLQSCCSAKQLAGDCVLQVQELVTACLSGTAWASRPSQLSCLSMAGAAAAAPDRTLDKQQQQKHRQSSITRGVNIWVAPAVGGSSSSSFLSAGSAGDGAGLQQQPQQQVPVELQQLATKLLALPRTVIAANSANSSGNTTTSSGCFSRPLSEKEWLRGAQRVWEAVQDSSELLQYYSLAAGARFTGAGGWRQR